MKKTKFSSKPLGSARGKGFTLIELLIVIAIIVVLAVITLLAINPAQILAKSRDSQRFSDLTTMATAINLYLADNHDFAGLGGPYSSVDAGFVDDNARKLNDGTGWIPLDFSVVSSGAPISALPLDPTNDATYNYRFGISVADKTYELDAVFEQDDNVAKHGSDGGTNVNRYEVGTDLTRLP